MDNGKRASMREGPLAQLFRKTDDGEGASERREEPQGEAERRPEVKPPEPPPHREEPSLAPPAPPQTPAGGRYEGTPTPEERLRTVFSSDIPENIMEREPMRAPEPELEPAVPAWSTDQSPSRQPVLRVIGVGGAGVNAVDRMIEAQIEGVEFIAVNTDLQSLEQSAALTKLHIGSDLTRGLGSGSNPEVGRQAALEDFDELKALLKGADMVFIATGAGGGTGTGAAPIVARISREVKALTVGICTKPFSFEGARRSAQADEGVEELASEVDTLIVIPNSRLLSVLNKKTSMVEAFRVADDVLRQGVQGVSDLITLPGLINLDFADVRTIMADAGQALLGIGMGTGESRAIDAVEHAIASPLLETSLDGAQSILLSITGSPDLSLFEVNDAAKAVADVAHPDANIIFGAMVDEKMGDEVWITVVATGYGAQPARREQPARGEQPLRRERQPTWIPADREPRVRRATRSGALGDIEVPEFLPRG